ARATVSQGTVYLAPGPRPNPNIANTLSWNYAGTASYHAMNASLTKRSRSGLTYKVNYTCSKVLDMNSAILNTYAVNEPPTVLNPNFNGPVILGVEGYKKTGRFFDPNAFVLPLPGTFGSSPRGFFTGPGLFTLDTSFFKKFSIDEKRTLQFRAEAFNVTNHTNFTTPNPAVFSGAAYSRSAGILTQTAGYSRRIQFALKLII